MSDIFPAATVVLIRDRNEALEVLMLRRSKDVKFGGGAWVFPGGRIDAADYKDDPEDSEKAAYEAAVRETQEEAGLRLNTSDLLYFAHWTAPPGTFKRFSTWFFIAAINGFEDVVVDGGEIDTHKWYQPQGAVDAFNNEQIFMMTPTVVTLTELCQCSSTAAAIAMYKARAVPEIKPVITVNDKNERIVQVGDAGSFPLK